MPVIDRAVGLTWSRPGTALLAVLSAASGAIHLAMVPAHFGEWAPAGVAFAAAGWLQLALAALLVNWPSRRVLRVSCLANVLFIGAWGVTRIWGWPVGPEAGAAEAATFIDVTCVALEAILVVGGLALLVRPQLGDGLDRSALRIAAVIPVGVLLLATAAIGSPSARNHDHAGADDHAHGNAAAMDHSHGAMDHGNPHGAAAVDDKGLSLLHNGHHMEMVYTKLSPEDQAAVDHFLAVSQEVVRKYPTLGSIKAAGAVRAGPYLPGLGIHYLLATVNSFNPDGVVDDTDMRNPLTVIYDGTSDDAQIAGFMYYSTAKDQPEGFPGTNDYWHFHSDVCDVMSSKGEQASIDTDGSLSPEQCEQLGGTVLKSTQWMVHFWSVPGYEVSEQDGGVFAEVNPKLTCPDGTYYKMTDVHDLIEHPFNACRSELTHPTAPA